MPKPDLEPRTGMPSPQLGKAAFKDRFKSQFQDPAFRPLDAELDQIAQVAWDGYSNARKSPLTRKAGEEFKDPDYDLAADWLAARDAIGEAQ